MLSGIAAGDHHLENDIPVERRVRWFRDSTQAGKVIRAAQQAMKDTEVQRERWFFLLPMDSMQS